jgi:hypothetical protein
MAVLKIRDSSNSSWIDVGGIGTVYQSDTAPASPSPGLMWLDTSTDSTFAGSSIQDEDGDTKIQTEESADEDIIRMDIGGTEMLVLQNDAVALQLTGKTNPIMEIKTTNTESAAGLSLADSGGIRWQILGSGTTHASRPDWLSFYNTTLTDYVMHMREDGTVSKPNNPCARWQTEKANVPTDATFYNFDAGFVEHYDIGENLTSDEGGKFIAPVAGKYLVSGNVDWRDIDNGTSRAIVRCAVGGSDTDQYLHDLDPAGFMSGDPDQFQLALSWVWNADASDYFKLQVYMSGGVAQCDVFAEVIVTLLQ